MNSLCCQLFLAKAKPVAAQSPFSSTPFRRDDDIGSLILQDVGMSAYVSWPVIRIRIEIPEWIQLYGLKGCSFLSDTGYQNCYHPPACIHSPICHPRLPKVVSRLFSYRNRNTEAPSSFILRNTGPRKTQPLFPRLWRRLRGRACGLSPDSGLK